LPSPLFKLALSLLRASGRAGGFGAAGTARMAEDLVFDATPAMRSLGYRPRRFEPEARMFSAD
ncbi:nucleoside-diphosphate sugar epimerase, partial [Lysobacter sp. D1-1-M9]